MKKSTINSNHDKKQGYYPSIGMNVLPLLAGAIWIFGPTGRSSPKVQMVLIGMGIFLSLSLFVWLLDYSIARLGVQRPIRSGVWISAYCGPIATGIALEQWETKSLSIIIGTLAVVLTFGCLCFLSKVWEHKNQT